MGESFNLDKFGEKLEYPFPLFNMLGTLVNSLYFLALVIVSLNLLSRDFTFFLVYDKDFSNFSLYL